MGPSYRNNRLERRSALTGVFCCANRKTVTIGKTGLIVTAVKGR